MENLERRQLLSADLTGVFTGKLPASLLLHGANHLTLAVTNVGDATAKGSVAVALYASADGTLDAGDTLLSTSPAKRVNLKPAKGKSIFALRFASPSNIADGNYFILADILSGSTVGDGNLANNLIPTPSTVAIRKAFVDLTGTVTRAPAGTIAIGGRHQKPTLLSAIVTNNGNVPAKGKLAVSFYASFNQSLDSSDTLLAATRAQAVSIAPGKSRKITTRVKLAGNVPSGTFFILANVNSTGGIAETDSANNVGASSGTVIISNPAIPPGPRLSGALASDISAVVVGAPEVVHFNVTVAGATSSTLVNVDEFDSAGNNLGLFTQLTDDGSLANNDQTAGDGIYSGINTLGFAAPGTRFFAAVVTDPSLNAPEQTATLSVPGITPPSSTQLQQDVTDAATLNDTAQRVVNGGGSRSAALAAVNAALASDSNVQPGSIQMSDHAISWLTADGILQGVDLASTPAAGQKAGPSTPLAASNAAPLSVQPAALTPLDATTPDPTKAAVCISPYAYAFNPADEAAPIAALLRNKAYTVNDAAINNSSSDANVTIDSFKNLNRYAAVVISSHGGLLPTSDGAILNGEGILTGVQASIGGYLSNYSDLRNNRLINIDGTYAITPKFIRTYTGHMNDSIVYVGACFSTVDDKLANAFLAAGADAYLGYSDVVNSPFATAEGQAAFTTLLKDTNNKVQDIPGINSATDPQSPNALFEFRGNPLATLPQPASLASNDVYVRYDWPQNQKDLDTSTGFLGTTAGFSQPGGQYLNWSGDNTGLGGEETTLVDISSAFTAGAWSTSTTITAAADWFTPSNGSGPALLTVGLENKTSGKLIDVTTKSINPNQETSGATTLVGNIVVTLGGDPANPTVILTVT